LFSFVLGTFEFKKLKGKKLGRFDGDDDWQKLQIKMALV
jgi:hypothetical protein